MIKKINYESDFSFILNLCDAHNKTFGFPDFDWEVVFYVSGSSETMTASCISGIPTNCKDDEGKLRIIFDNAKIGLGQLKATVTAEIPNETYPDKTQKVVVPTVLGIELVKEATTYVPNIEETIILPVVANEDGEPRED